MLLSDLNIIGRQGLQHICIEDGRITAIGTERDNLPVNIPKLQLNLKGMLAFPGLVNSHDHLDFDLFPQLANKKYKNYTEWGADIHTVNKQQIDAVLAIPLKYRVQWGVYKNLLAGVTTVVNHGEKLNVEDELIGVFQQCQSIHSVERGKNWKYHLNKMYKRPQPVAVHIGEGTDELCSAEIDRFLKWNYLNRDIIGIHGVAMSERQASEFKALVWCPVSNYLLFDQTAAIDKLKNHVTILFGTDSTLTASWNIWDHLRVARDSKMVTDAELFEMLTTNAAKIWKLSSAGQLAPGQWADMVVARQDVNLGQWDAIYQLNPADILLVTYHGNIKMFDVELLEQLSSCITIESFSKIYIDGVPKYVQGDLPGLLKEIRKFGRDIEFPISSH